MGKMMGRLKGQEELFSYAINLEKRVRADHPLRRVAEGVDFSFVRQEVAHLYGNNGNESVPPEVILKLMFLLFFEDIGSEREMMRMIPERLDYLWFLGYGLDDEIPDHSVLSKARARWGQEVFEKFFVRVVEQCVAAGLVEGRTLHLDGSLIEANAATDSVLKGGAEIIGQLKEIYGVLETKLEQGGKRDKQRSNRRLVSRSDPDAAVARKGREKARPRYKHHRGVDNAHGVITAVETTAGDVEENARLVTLVEQHEMNTGIRVGTVVADRQYGTADNFRECWCRGIRSHMADLQASYRRQQPRYRGKFGEADFVYDEQMDGYRCPGGALLTRRTYHKKQRCWVYRGDRKTCSECAERSRCTEAKKAGRMIKRLEDQEAIDQARRQAHSREAHRDRRRRQFLMEGSFADAANNHHFKRARWRRLWRQQIQDYLIATAQNIRLLLRTSRLRPAASLAQPVLGTLSRLFLTPGARFCSFEFPFRPDRLRLMSLWISRRSADHFPAPAI